MPRELIFTGPRALEFREVPREPLGDRAIRVRTLFSGISHGTEMSLYRGTAPGMTKGLIDGLFKGEVAPVYRYPFPYGYEAVGKIVEVGSQVTEYHVGDNICAWYGHRDEAVVSIDGNETLCRLPQSGSLEHFIFLPLTSVALDSLLTGGLRLGESAIVFGQGAVGLLITQICKLAGAYPVIAVDVLDERLALAKRLGADYVLNPSKRPVAEAVRELLPDTRGADVVFEASTTYKGLHEAIRCGAPGYSKLVATASYLGDATDLRLGEEFSHGGSLMQGGCTQILTNMNRMPRAFGRQWHRQRVWMAAFELLRTGRMQVESLITHRFSFEKAFEAFDLIDKHPEQTVKTILTF